MFKKLQLKTMALLALLLIGAGSAWGADADVTYDFTGSDWTVSNGTLTNGTVSFTGKGSANFKLNGGYFFMGKSGAYLNFPKYDKAVEKIVVTGRSGASGSVKQNIYVGETAVSTETTGATGTNTYEIASANQAAGTQYTLKVTSDHNSQITKIEVYYSTAPADTRTDIATIGDLAVTSLPYNAEGTFTVNVTAADPSLVAGEDYELTWSSSDDDIIDVDAQSGEYLVGNTKGTVTITATVTALDDETYKNVTKDFEITVYDPNANDGTLAKPFTVAEAIEATPAIGTSEEYYIKGIVCSFEKASIIDDGTNYRYYISDDGSTANKLLVYGGKGLNNVAFAAADDLMVGDEVVIYGGLTKYNSTKEVASGNYIVSLKRKADHGLAYAETERNTHPNDAAFTAPTLTNPNSLTVTYSTSDAEVAAVNATTGAVTIGAKEGTATITATFAGDETYKAGSASYTINVARTAVTLSFSETEVTLKKGDAFEAPTFTKNPADLEGVVFSSSYPAVATVSDAGVIALGDATGTAVITATFAETDEYKAAQASVTITVNEGDPIVEPTPAGKYVKVTATDDIVDGQYLIVYEAGNVAFNGALSTFDAASNTVSVTIEENEIAATNAINNASFTIDVTEGSIKGTSGKYVGVGSYSNGLSTNDTAVENSFKIDNDGNVVISITFAGGDMTLRYNSASNQNRFRYYKSGQQAVQLYKYVAGEPVANIDIAVSSAGFATYVSNFDLDYSGVEGLFAYKAQMSGDKISFTKVDKVPAGEGVLLRATNGGTQFTVPTTTSAEALEGNLFVRGTGAAVASEADGKKNYILNIVDDKIGFYRAAGQTVATNRAYLSTTVSTARIALSFDDETTGIAIIDNGQLTIDNSVYDLQGRRVAQPQKGLYIVNGKKVVLK